MIKSENILQDFEELGIYPLKELYTSLKKEGVNSLADQLYFKYNFKKRLEDTIKKDNHFYTNNKNEIGLYDLEVMQSAINTTTQYTKELINQENY